MWIVTPDKDHHGQPIISVVHTDTIVSGAHLIGIAGEDHVPWGVTFYNSLDAFSAFYVNKYIDHHAHELVVYCNSLKFTSCCAEKDDFQRCYLNKLKMLFE